MLLLLCLAVVGGVAGDGGARQEAGQRFPGAGQRFARADQGDPTALYYYSQPTGPGYFDPAAYSEDQYSQYSAAYPGLQSGGYTDALVEKQGTGPTPADFFPFLASFSLPLGSAIITFVALVSVRNHPCLDVFILP